MCCDVGCDLAGFRLEDGDVLCHNHTASLFMEPKYDAGITAVRSSVLIFGDFRQKAVKPNGNKQRAGFFEKICKF